MFIQDSDESSLLCIFVIFIMVMIATTIFVGTSFSNSVNSDIFGIETSPNSVFLWMLVRAESLGGEAGDEGDGEAAAVRACLETARGSDDLLNFTREVVMDSDVA